MTDTPEGLTELPPVLAEVTSDGSFTINGTRYVSAGSTYPFNRYGYIVTGLLVATADEGRTVKEIASLVCQAGETPRVLSGLVVPVADGVPAEWSAALAGEMAATFERVTDIPTMNALLASLVRNLAEFLTFTGKAVSPAPAGVED